jgi:hypothetical protein
MAANQLRGQAQLGRKRDPANRRWKEELKNWLFFGDANLPASPDSAA